MATVNNYGDVTVRGITYTGKGSDGSAAVSSWPITASSTYYYNWYTNTSAAGTVSEVSSSATALYLQHYVTVDGSMPLNPYRVGYYSTGAFGYVREDAFPYGVNTIKYAANGGTGAPSSGTMTYGTAFTVSSTVPTRTGYTFGGWQYTYGSTTYTVQAGGTIPTSRFTTYAWNSSATLTLAAQWNIITYTVSYDANGGTGAPSSQTKQYGTALTLSTTKPTRTGYTFLGWATSASATTATYSAGGSYTANASATLYAVWQIKTYAITYNSNGGSGSVANQTKTYGTPLTLQSSGYTRTGYTLTGWNTASDGSGTSYALGGSYTANSAATLYAQWTIISYTITYNNNGGSGTINSQTKNYGASVTLASSGFTRSLYTLSGWNTNSGGTGTSYALGATYSTNANLALYAVWAAVSPSAPSSVVNTRNSDTSNTVSWTNPSAVISSTSILRSVDGGSFATLTTFSGSATSYTDTSTGANHYYAYKVAVTNSSGTATSASSGTTYNTPAAPTAITAARDSSNAVVLTITNPAVTATALELQRSTDASTWTTVATVSGTVTSTTDSPGGGTFYYRARNTRGTLASAYSAASNSVVTVVAPNPPTLVTPANSAVFSTAASTITVQWTHNTIDGSAQTYAQVRYSTDGGSSWTTATVTGATATYSITDGFSDNTTVTWQVRTKGAADDYSDWSASRTFTVYQQPSVSITAPASGDTITTMPIGVTLSYSDGVNTLSSATLTVYDGTTAVYTVSLGTATSTSIDADEWLPTNGGAYTLQADVTSTSGLTASTAADISVSFVEPDTASLACENNPYTGTVSIQATIDSGSGATSAESISIYRVANGNTVLLASGLADGASVTDYYAPLNTEYTYIAATFAASGAAAQTVTANTLVTNRFFMMWDGGTSFAYGIYDGTGNVAMTRPERVQVRYAGRKWPVSYDGVALDDSRTLTWTVETLDERDRLYALMDGATGVYKSLDGDVFPADFEVRINITFTAPATFGKATAAITRIDGTV